MRKYGEKLTQLRTKKGITQKELALALKITIQTLQKWENGSVRLKMNDIIKICTYFQCSSDYLLGLED